MMAQTKEVLLNVVNLTKYYGRKLGIANVNLSVSSGEIIGFVGPNGAGKTTTMRTIMGFLKPSSGEVFLFGQKVTQKNLNSLIKNVGYVPGEVNYYGDITVSKILEFYSGFYKNFDGSYCEYLCKEFDLQLSKKFEELSLGNKKKVSIIQALAHKPKLLILDEPTNSLDPFVQRKLYRILRTLKEEGVGVFFSSHILSEVENLCDKVIFLKEGKILEPEFFDRYTKKIIFLLKPELRFEESGIYKLLKDIKRETEDMGGKVVEIFSDNSTITIYFKGNANALVQFLKKIPNQMLMEVEELSIETISLEDIFENLYKHDTNQSQAIHQDRH
ncbi:MAG: ABC transporter ATP-binding protein [Fervidobacterium sp.]